MRGAVRVADRPVRAARPLVGGRARDGDVIGL